VIGASLEPEALEICREAITSATVKGYRVAGLEIGRPVYTAIFGPGDHARAHVFALPVVVNETRGNWATALVRLGDES